MSEETNETNEINERIVKVNIDKEMRSAYIDYSMSVIVSRALPDVRDGLKPVHRRVLFGMNEMGVFANRPTKKSARIVGEVMGKFHPHGDSSVYFTMVRLAQDWVMRYPLVDGQGNFGSVDGDPPAAMRYTEARLKKIAEDTLIDLDKDAVDFVPNFDESLKEPVVLPTRIPLLLVNGASGIAVGMATNMAPHNLSDTIDAIVAYIDNNDISIEELIPIIKAPDFPSGGIIYGYQGVKDAYLTGRGRLVIRSKYHIETTHSGKPQIIFDEIPYMVNKAEQISKIAELVNDKKIEDIVHANDESDRKGMRVVVTLKNGAIPNVVVNKLFKLTQFQTTFSVNNIALVNGRPKLLNLKELIVCFVKHRQEVVVRRSKYELAQAQKRAHILEGLLIALDHLDEVIALIRASRTPDEARVGLMDKFGLSDAQARAILEMRLQKLTGLEREKVKQEYDDIMKYINYLNEVIGSVAKQMEVVKDELLQIKDKYHDERKTHIEYAASEDFNPEDFYADEDVVITISKLGYIKRTPLAEFKTQNRGGKGSKGSTTRDEDFISHIFSATNHNTMLFFTEKGKCFWLKVYEIPEGNKTSKGRAIQNVLNIESDDSVKAYINVKSITDPEYVNSHYIIMCTKKGVVKKTPLSEYSRPRTNGINAINVREGDTLLEAKLTDGTNDILIGIRGGKAVRFNETDARPIGRTGTGVRGITVPEGDEVIGMVVANADGSDGDILVVSENGYGKRSKLEDYRITSRGGKGVKTINITEKTGELIAIDKITDNDDLMIINKSGITIRLKAENIRTAARLTQGVKLIELNTKKKDSIASIAVVPKTDDEEEIGEEQVSETSEVSENTVENVAENNSENQTSTDNIQEQEN
ncbi:MAG: DNA gyrase subunit A [Bacteroidales bacterium]|nr:DNA gyrase subunit A [Bacteroidales bacterium]